MFPVHQLVGDVRPVVRLKKLKFCFTSTDSVKKHQCLLSSKSKSFVELKISVSDLDILVFQGDVTWRMVQVFVGSARSSSRGSIALLGRCGVSISCLVRG